MNTSLLKLLSVVALPSMLAVGCGGSSKNTGKGDLAIKGGDMAVKGGDMAATGSCTTIATFPSSMIFAENDSDSSGLNFFVAGQAANPTTPANSDQVQYSFASSTTTAPTLPHTVTATSSDTLSSTCQGTGECVLGFFDIPDSDTSQGADELYLPQGGTYTLTAFQNTPTGTVTVSGSSLNFVHWDGDNDVAQADGKCVNVTSFNFNTSFTPPPDGGN